MKRLLSLSLVALSMSAFSQSSFVVRPSLGNPELTNGSGKEVMESTVGVGEVMHLTIPVYNNSFAQPVRVGTGRLEIDLGAIGTGGLEVVSLPSSQVFSWDKPSVRDGHLYVSGRLVSAMGVNYEDRETLVLKATGPLNTRIRATWIDAVPAKAKRSDLFAEMQVKVTGTAVTTSR